MTTLPSDTGHSIVSPDGTNLHPHGPEASTSQTASQLTHPFLQGHAAYSIYCTRGCEVSLQNCPFSREGGSGPPRNEVVLPDISVARLAHRHTGHYSRALKWSKYIWTECNQSSDLDMQRVDPWLLVNTVTFPPVSFILNSSHTQTHTVIQTDCIASRHTATAESMGEASIQSNARISWNGTTATTTIIPV